MSIEIFVVYPPERDGRVAELNVRRPGVVEIPAEVFEDQGTLMITLFSRADGPAWTFELREFRSAVDRAATAVMGGSVNP